MNTVHHHLECLGVRETQLHYLDQAECDKIDAPAKKTKASKNVAIDYGTIDSSIIVQ
jgi:hypothetical protein